MEMNAVEESGLLSVDAEHQRSEMVELRAAVAQQQKITMGAGLVACLALCIAFTGHSPPSTTQLWGNAVSVKSSSAIPRVPEAQAPATTELWAGSNHDIIPSNQNACNTAEWPPQMAPIRKSGDFIMMSGVLGYDVPCKTAEKDVTKQVEKAFILMAGNLKAAGVDWKDLVSVTSYHVGSADDEAFAAFFTERQKYFKKGEPMPAWTAVFVKGLFFEHEILEMEASARVPPCLSLECA